AESCRRALALWGCRRRDLPVDLLRPAARHAGVRGRAAPRCDLEARDLPAGAGARGRSGDGIVVTPRTAAVRRGVFRVGGGCDNLVRERKVGAGGGARRRQRGNPVRSQRRRPTMTQPCTERDGLPHAVFLRRLAGARAATSTDARLGNAAFLVLRLVDLLGPSRGPAHADVFRYQHAATEHTCRELPNDCTETGHLTGLVRATADAFQEQDVRVVAPALLAYAYFLEDELRLDEAL